LSRLGKLCAWQTVGDDGGQSGAPASQPPDHSSGSQSGAPSSATGAGQIPKWGAVTLCGVGGAGIGSVPLIVHKLSSSPGGDD